MDFTERRSTIWSWFWGQEDLVGNVCTPAKGQFQKHMYEEGIMEYFLETSSQPPIWNSQMSRTFDNSSKPKNQIALFKCILNWVLRQKNSNNLWRCRVSLTGLIPENVVKICIRQSSLSTWIKKKPELMLISILCWCGICLSVCMSRFVLMPIYILCWCGVSPGDLLRPGLENCRLKLLNWVL